MATHRRMLVLVLFVLCSLVAALVGAQAPQVPSAPGDPAGSGPMRATTGVLAAAGEYVYVLRGGRLAQFSARDLRKVRETTVGSEGSGESTARRGSAADDDSPRPAAAFPAGWAAPSMPATTAEVLNAMWSRGQAEGRGPVKLATFPLRVEDAGTIIPMGLMASGHVTPSDHLYLVPKDASVTGRGCDVVAVADGSVVCIQWRPNPPGGQPDPTVFDRAVDLKVVIEHSATCWSYLDHLVEVDESIMRQVGGTVQPGQPLQVRIPVKAGQVVGKVGRQTLDFALVDTTTSRKGFLRPEQFLHRDPWKPHTVDPFDYVDEPLKGKLLALNPRRAAPYGGRIDYDVDGKLVGNWYEEGTGGYAGLNRRLDYWVGHLSLAYHHVDPSVIVVSLGNFDGQARQFWVKGNGPDPAKVSAADGPVKYEFLYGRMGSSGQRHQREDADVVQGTALAQVLPNRRLRFEVFPGKTRDQVDGFTRSARFYER